MKLKLWWQKRQETLAIDEVNFYWKEYLKRCVQSPTEHRKIIARQYFPRVGQDLLAQKENFLREYAIHEHEFRSGYVAKNRSDAFVCQYSLKIEEKARLAGHQKWCDMVRQFRSQQSKIR